MVLKERGVAYVVAVDAESPAAQAGIQRGDIVSKIGSADQASESSRDLPLWRIRELLSGEPGQKLELELVRQGEAIEAHLTLATYPALKASLREIGGVTVVQLPSFSTQAQRSLDEALAQARSTNRPLLIDLRGVAGDDPEQGFEVAKRFAQGELGKLSSRDAVLETYRSDSEPAWAAPSIAVLIDRGSQGAAEVLASVLHQRAGALLLGEESYGHAGRTTRVNLSSGAFLELTDAFYAGPDGVLLTESLEPDFEVEGIRFATGEDAEEVLERAVGVFVEQRPAARSAA
jgi:carboxyl-terminal processing protease